MKSKNCYFDRCVDGIYTFVTEPWVGQKQLCVDCYPTDFLLRHGIDRKDIDFVRREREAKEKEMSFSCDVYRCPVCNPVKETCFGCGTVKFDAPYCPGCGVKWTEKAAKKEAQYVVAYVDERKTTIYSREKAIEVTEKQTREVKPMAGHYVIAKIVGHVRRGNDVVWTFDEE